MTLGERLREARENKGHSQTYVAKTLGLTSQAISNYERGERDPDTPLLKTLAEFYEVSTDYLLGRYDKFSVSHEHVGEPSESFYKHMGLTPTSTDPHKDLMPTPPDTDDIQPTPPERIRTFQKKIGELSEESLTFLEFQLDRLRELDQEAVNRRRSERDPKRDK